MRSTKTEEIQSKEEENPSVAQGKKPGQKPKDKRRGNITFDGWLEDDSPVQEINN